MTGAPFTFASIVATESIEARAAVHKFAARLFREQQATHADLVEGGKQHKGRAPTWQECLNKSRQIRRKREVNDTHASRLITRHNNL